MEARGRQATPARLSQFSDNNGRHFLGLFHGLDTVQSVSPRLSLSLSLSFSIPSGSLRISSMTSPS